MHLDFTPLPECRRPEDTYGEVCIKCNECGRFEVTALAVPVRDPKCSGPGKPCFEKHDCQYRDAEGICHCDKCQACPHWPCWEGK